MEPTQRDHGGPDGSSTIHEQNSTVREGNSGSQGPGRRYEKVVDKATGDTFILTSQLPTMGAEADIYIARYKSDTEILKLYRYGIDPKQEIIERYSRVSHECPEHVVQVRRYGIDRDSGRWYELLEYIEHGSVADAIQNGIQFDFKEFVRELASAVNALHEHGIVHRDLKPSNILMRSVEPLDLVLSDFGISSVLDGASRRETSTMGLTPMYAAPEDMQGSFVSKQVDWWACGMIFYEILAGVHPFKGLSHNRIMVLLSTRGVEVDEALQKRDIMLLKGLLTRNDKKRWGWQQIEEWLAGKDDIPIYYEIPQAETASKPFIFDGKPYDSLHDLALAFASGLQQFELAKGMLARGNVSKWLQNNNQFDEEATIAERIACNDPVLYLFKFMRAYAPELPFTLYGSSITPENILIWLTGTPEKGEEEILDLFRNGNIRDFLRFLPEELKDPRIEALANADWSKDMVVPLTALIFPERFYWGPAAILNEPADFLNFTQAHPGILSVDAWQQMGGPHLVISPNIAELFNRGEYEKAVAMLEDAMKNRRILYSGDTQNRDSRNLYLGSQEDYNHEVGRKNGLNAHAISIIRKIQNIMTRRFPLDERAFSSPNRAANKLCAPIRAFLDGLQSGKIIWQQSIYKALKMVYHYLSILAGSDRISRFMRFSLRYLLIPALILFPGYLIFDRISIDSTDWAASECFRIVKWSVYIIFIFACGFGSAFLGRDPANPPGVLWFFGALFGFGMAYLIVWVLKGFLVPALGSLIPWFLIIIIIGILLFYLVFSISRHSYRIDERKRKILLRLENIVKSLYDSNQGQPSPQLSINGASVGPAETHSTQPELYDANKSRSIVYSSVYDAVHNALFGGSSSNRDSIFLTVSNSDLARISLNNDKTHRVALKAAYDGAASIGYSIRPMVFVKPGRIDIKIYLAHS